MALLHDASESGLIAVMRTFARLLRFQKTSYHLINKVLQLLKMSNHIDISRPKARRRLPTFQVYLFSHRTQHHEMLDDIQVILVLG